MKAHRWQSTDRYSADPGPVYEYLTLTQTETFTLKSTRVKVVQLIADVCCSHALAVWSCPDLSNMHYRGTTKTEAEVSRMCGVVAGTCFRNVTQLNDQSDMGWTPTSGATERMSLTPPHACSCASFGTHVPWIGLGHGTSHAARDI